MAKSTFGYLDGFSGKVGPVVGYRWRGLWCMRSRPTVVANPCSDAQVQNLARFKLMVRTAALLRPAIDRGLRQCAHRAHMTEANYFVMHNRPHFGLSASGLTVDYPSLVVSLGCVDPALPLELEVSEAGVATVLFADDGLTRHLSPNDQVYLLAYCPGADSARLATPVFRYQRRVSFVPPAEWQGHSVYLYCFAQDTAGNASPSRFAGTLAADE